jgi:DNA-binding PadR family transcriptional regulator
MKADPNADLLPGEWAVLGVLTRAHAHGFAIGRTLAADGWLGRVWTMSRPRVYRAINDLATRGLIEPTGRAESERGPVRTLYGATAAGQAHLDAWLAEPVDHVREIRSELLLKLALLFERGASPQALLAAQRMRLVPVLEHLEEAVPASGFDAILLRYRVETTRAALRFVDDIVGSASELAPSERA